MPGDNIEVDCTLHSPLAVEVGSRFTLREGHKTSMYSQYSTVFSC